MSVERLAVAVSARSTPDALAASYWTQPEVCASPTCVVGAGSARRVAGVEDILLLRSFVARWLRRRPFRSIGSSTSERNSKGGADVGTARRRRVCRRTLLRSSVLFPWLGRLCAALQRRRTAYPNSACVSRLVDSHRAAGAMARALLTLRVYRVQRRQGQRILRACLVVWRAAVAAQAVLCGVYRSHLREAFRRWQRRDRWPAVQRSFRRATELRWLRRWWRGTQGHTGRASRWSATLALRAQRGLRSAWCALQLLAARRRSMRISRGFAQRCWRISRTAAGLRCWLTMHRVIATTAARQLVALSRRRGGGSCCSRGLLRLVVHAASAHELRKRRQRASSWFHTACGRRSLRALHEAVAVHHARVGLFLRGRDCHARRQQRMALWALAEATRGGRNATVHWKRRQQHQQRTFLAVLLSVSHQRMATRATCCQDCGIATRWLLMRRQWACLRGLSIYARRSVQLRRSLKIFRRLHPLPQCSYVLPALRAWRENFVPAQQQLRAKGRYVLHVKLAALTREAFHRWFYDWENALPQRWALKRVLKRLRGLRLQRLTARSNRLAPLVLAQLPAAQAGRIFRLQQHHREHQRQPGNCGRGVRGELAARAEQRRAWCDAASGLLADAVAHAHCCRDGGDSSDGKYGGRVARAALLQLLRLHFWTNSAALGRKCLFLLPRFRQWQCDYTAKARAARLQLQEWRGQSACQAAASASKRKKAEPMGCLVLLRRVVRAWAEPIRERSIALFRIRKRCTRVAVFRAWLELQRSTFIYRQLPPPPTWVGAQLLKGKQQQQQQQQQQQHCKPPRLGLGPASRRVTAVQPSNKKGNVGPLLAPQRTATAPTVTAVFVANKENVVNVCRTGSGINQASARPPLPPQAVVAKSFLAAQPPRAGYGAMRFRISQQQQRQQQQVEMKRAVLQPKVAHKVASSGSKADAESVADIARRGGRRVTFQ